MVAFPLALTGCGATVTSTLTPRADLGGGARAAGGADATASSADDAAAVHDAVADRVAEATFLAAEAELRAFESFTIAPSGTLVDQIRLGAAAASRIGAAYDAVVARRRPRWTVAALVGQARTYEVLARAIQTAPLALLGAPPPGTPGTTPPAVSLRLMASIRAGLEPETRVVECLAVSRYVLALRAARTMSLDDTHTREASDRLRTYHEQRITECVELMRRGDSAHSIPPDASIVPYRVGEFGAGAPATPPPGP